MGEIGITRIEPYVADGRRWKPRKEELALRTPFAWRLMPVSLALFLCSLIFDVAPIQAQTNLPTQDERNTIEVFRLKVAVGKPAIGLDSLFKNVSASVLRD